MSGVVGMEDKLLDQVICWVKQDILKNNKAHLQSHLLKKMDINTNWGKVEPQKATEINKLPFFFYQALFFLFIYLDPHHQVF